jgi:putative hydrolase of the HAD superfamily
MRIPKMVVFDYGQTLIREEPTDRTKGTEAVLANCFSSPKGISAEEVQALANDMNRDIGRYDSASSHLCVTEVHNHPFQNYLYEYFGLTRIVPSLEMEAIFWDAASPGSPTEHIFELLAYLKKMRIRSSVISNISMSGQVLANRINALLPQNEFEFILASSEYVYRKPHRRLFELAARKAQLDPCDMWYCGDDVICDVDGAEAAGMVPVWYKGAYEGQEITPKADCLVISDWLELIAIFCASRQDKPHPH